MKEVQEALTKFIRKLCSQGFWGTVEIKMEKGSIVHISTKQNKKPQELVEEFMSPKKRFIVKGTEVVEESKA